MPGGMRVRCSRWFTGTSLNDLKEKIQRCWAELSQGLIDRAVDQWRPRLQAVVKAKEGHIEQLV